MVKPASELCKDINFLFKIVECVCCHIMCIMVGLEKTTYFNFRIQALVIISAGGYFIITVTLCIIYIFDDANWLFQVLVLIYGGIMFIISGIFCLVDFFGDSERTLAYLIAIFSLGCGAVMIIDLTFLIINKKNKK